MDASQAIAESNEQRRRIELPGVGMLIDHDCAGWKALMRRPNPTPNYNPHQSNFSMVGRSPVPYLSKGAVRRCFWIHYVLACETLNSSGEYQRLSGTPFICV